MYPGGIVTLEDIIEQIVGDIDDEYDEVDSMYRRISPGVYEFEGKIPIVDFCHVLDIQEEDLGDEGCRDTGGTAASKSRGDFPVDDGDTCARTSSFPCDKYGEAPYHESQDGDNPRSGVQ